MLLCLICWPKGRSFSGATRFGLASGRPLRSALQKPYAVLPQMQLEVYEPMFDVVHKTYEEFNKFWKPHRNLIFWKSLIERILKPSLNFFKDVMLKAKPTSKPARGQRFSPAISKGPKRNGEPYSQQRGC